MLGLLLQVESQCVYEAALLVNMHTLTLEIKNPDDIVACAMQNDQQFRVVIEGGFEAEFKYTTESGLLYRFEITCDSYHGDDCQRHIDGIDDLTVVYVDMAYEDRTGATVNMFSGQLTYYYGQVHAPMTKTQEDAIIGTYTAFALLFVALIVIYILVDVFKPKKQPYIEEQ